MSRSNHPHLSRPLRGRAAPSYHHGDLRQALLDAVAGIIREKGIGSVSLREAARRARVSHSAPAHHFPSKASLLTAFATEGYARLGVTIAAELAGSRAADGPARLEAVGRGYVRFAVENPEHFGMMFRIESLDTRDPEFRRAGESAYAMLTSVVAQCGEEGRLRGRVPQKIAIASWSLVHGLAALWIDGRLADRMDETDPHLIAADVCRLFVEALTSEPHPRRRRPGRDRRARRVGGSGQGPG